MTASPKENKMLIFEKACFGIIHLIRVMVDLNLHICLFYFDFRGEE